MPTPWTYFILFFWGWWLMLWRTLLCTADNREDCVWRSLCGSSQVQAGQMLWMEMNVKRPDSGCDICARGKSEKFSCMTYFQTSHFRYQAKKEGSFRTFPFRFPHLVLLQISSYCRTIRCINRQMQNKYNNNMTGSFNTSCATNHHVESESVYSSQDDSFDLSACQYVDEIQRCIFSPVILDGASDDLSTCWAFQKAFYFDLHQQGMERSLLGLSPPRPLWIH